MTNQGKKALAIVAQRRAELVAAATNAQVRTKLENLNEVCRVLVVEAAQRLTVPEVVRRYKARFPATEQNLAEQSLRNKRGGKNPYAVLYAAWEGAAEFVLAPSRGVRQPPSANELLSMDDVAGIQDIALRHQVGLVVAQNRSQKAELDILKCLGTAPVVRISAGVEAAGFVGAPALANHLALTETEVESVRNFLDARQLRARGLKRAEDGAIESMDGRRFSDPDFADALEKIVRSYEL